MVAPSADIYNRANAAAIVLMSRFIQTLVFWLSNHSIPNFSCICIP
jgi:hypothetical protein